MTLGELIAQARLELDDVEEDYLWTDPELISYANEAQNQACRRSRLIIDSSTVEICEIPVIANTAAYPLDDRIIAVRNVTLDGKSKGLTGHTVSELEECVSNWAVQTGEPIGIATDYETGKIRLFPIPLVDGLVRLRVVRMPLVELVALNDVPEIKKHYHRSLIHWIKHMAYLKKDADTLDKSASAESLALFEMEFGKPKPAYNIEFELTNTMFGNLDGSW